MPRGPAGPPGSGPNRAQAHLNPRRIRDGFAAAAPSPASPTPVQPAGATAPAYLKNCSHHCNNADPGLIDLFNHYKFTVEENTPNEREVALDPELLGRVFENLLATINPESHVTARRATGTYYTPREVVDYMVDETLVASLRRQVPAEDRASEAYDDKLRHLLDYNDDCADAENLFTPSERQHLVNAIADLKTLDPAAGSGAFPMGILHKLTLALRRLDPTNDIWHAIQRQRARHRATTAFETDDKLERDVELQEISNVFEHYKDSDFGRKLFLIQNCIYGVDILPIATQIAKLRFFISLAIEQDSNSDPNVNFGISPLPNLETRFVAANSLIGLDRPTQLSLSQTDAVITLEQELTNNREQFFHAKTRSRKKFYRKRDIRLRQQLAKELLYVGFPADSAKQIASWNPFDQSANTAEWFDSEYMFGVAKGFDIVIGNPPYVKPEHLDPQTRQSLKNTFGWQGDLYEYFVFSGFGAVKNGGLFSFIANDSFVTFSSKEKIRDLFLQNQLLSLVKAPAQTFDASIYTAIFVLARSEPSQDHTYISGAMIAPRFLYESFGKVGYATVYKLPNKRFLLNKENPLLMRLLKLERIDSVCDILDTGIDSGNVRSKIFFKEDNGFRDRLLQGKQIHRYSLKWDSPNALYLFCNIHYNLLPIPGIGRKGKPSKLNEYWRFRGSVDNHHQSERLLMRQSDDDLVVAYHSESELGRFYTDNTLFTILCRSDRVDLKFLLALFNSRLLNFLYHCIAQEQGKSQAQVKVNTVRSLPIVIPSHYTMV